MMKFGTLVLFGAIWLSYYAGATDLAPNSSQGLLEQQAFAKAFHGKDAKTALDLAKKYDGLHQGNATAILFVLLAAVEFDEFKEFYSHPYNLTQDANRIGTEGQRIGSFLSAMVHDLAKYKDGDTLRQRAVEFFIFSDLHALSVFTTMLQTRQFPKLSAIFFDDMDLLKKFINPSNYCYLNMSTGMFPENAQTVTDVDQEVNKKNFIVIAHHCARTLKKVDAAKLLEEHL